MDLQGLYISWVMNITQENVASARIPEGKIEKATVHPGGNYLHFVSVRGALIVWIRPWLILMQ